MRKIFWLLVFVAPLTAPAANAAGLKVRIVDQRGAPVADAVVTVVPRDATSPPAPAHKSETRVIDQKNLMFVPYVEVFRPGDSVVFRNSDNTRHHVYSFSPAKAFEFVLTPGQSSAPLVLDKSGVVAVGCNIHDRMIAYLYISDAPWIAHSGADGTVSFDTLPAGAYEVRVWQPRLRPNKPDLAQTATVLGDADPRTLTFTLSLLPDPRTQFDREHTSY
jgi:plastocyanin